MVFINGKKFKVYDLDTIDTILSRIASTMKTTTIYLYFTEGEPTYNTFKSNNNIIVNDLLETIKKNARVNGSIINLIGELKPKMKGYNIKQRIIEVWMAYNTQLAKDIEIQGTFALESTSEVLEKPKGEYYYKGEVEREWLNRDRFKDIIESDIHSNSEKSKKYLQLAEEFKETEEVFSTDIDLERIKLDLVLNVNRSILELFNETILNSYVPFCKALDFFKILKDFKPPEIWGVEKDIENNNMMLYILEKEYSYTVKPDNYSIVNISNINNSVNANITIKMMKGYVTKDTFIKRFINIFPNLPIKVEQEKENEITALFFYPSFLFFHYIFSDLVMNDIMFSNLMYIDEFDRSTTKTHSSIYIHFNHPLTGEVTARLSQKKVTKNDPELRNQDPDFFPIGETYIKVRATAGTTKQLEKFRQFLGKLLTIYVDRKNEIVSFYRKYIPNFASIQIEAETYEIKTLEEVDPDLFVKKYSRSCSEAVTNISEEQALNAIEQGIDVMKFPRDAPINPDSIKFPMDGINQNYYICEHPKHKYVGLKENTLKNSDIFPYIPCCYINDQKNKPGYKYYFEGIEPVSDEKQTDIIKTNKILDNNQLGHLPSNISNLFILINPDPKYIYLRKGVFKNENSFLKVVMEALSDETNINEITNQMEAESVLNDTRKLLATKELASLCKQEMYDSTIDEIINSINNLDVYLDPKLYIHLLEEYFNVNIFLFSQRIMDGEMILPRHLQAYYKTVKKSKCIYVYEHGGSETDIMKYPQCELIVKFNSKGETKEDRIPQESFSYEESVHLRSVYEIIRKSYCMDKRIEQTVGLPWKANIKILSQGIDSYGKTRKLNIKYEDRKISILTSPIQPIKAINDSENKIYKAHNIKTVLKLSQELGITILSQTITNDLVKEINGILGNINISIPVEDSPINQNITEKYSGVDFSDIKFSALNVYNNNKKLARYFTEYTYWMYSKYLFNRNINQITDENIAKFAKKSFIIDENHTYGNVSNTLTTSSTFFVKNGNKLVVTSEETLKRLIYVLRLASIRNKDGILAYHTRTTIQNYYIDISDFDQHSNQVILYGDESVEKWIEKNNIIYTLHDGITVGSSPYFFKNKLVNNKIYLAQNTSSEEQAYDIAITWYKEGYNPQIYAKKHKRVAFTLYKYINSSNIESDKIPGKKTNYDIKILGYKINSKEYFTVLLDL